MVRAPPWAWVAPTIGLQPVENIKGDRAGSLAAVATTCLLLPPVRSAVPPCLALEPANYGLKPLETELK